MKNEFQLFDKQNKLFDYLFSEIDNTIKRNPRIRKRSLKILSCYFGSETDMLERVKTECTERQIELELILTKNIFYQNQDILKSNKTFKAYPNKSETFFHGKAIAYIHGRQVNVKSKNNIYEPCLESGEAFLISTSANFSNAYIGDNVETGILLNNKKTINSFLLKFENSKGEVKKNNKPVEYNSLFDIFSNGYILFQDDSNTLSALTTIHFPLKKSEDKDSKLDKIGGKITEGNLSVSFDKAEYFNIANFEKKYPKSKNILTKYVIKTPYGLWINKAIFEEIENLYSKNINDYIRCIREVITPKNIKSSCTGILDRIEAADGIIERLEYDKKKLKENVQNWQNKLILDLNDDNKLKTIFHGYEKIEFPLDPINNKIFEIFKKQTKKLNYKKDEAKNPTISIKNVLRSLFEDKTAESDSVKLKKLSATIEGIKEEIRSNFESKNENKMPLIFNPKTI